MLRLIERPEARALLRVPPATRAVVSWNSDAPAGELALIVHHTDGSVSKPLPYARWSAGARRSLDGADARARIAVDTLESGVPFSALGVTSTVPLDALAVTVPSAADEHGAARARADELDVPPLSQYLADHPGRRGWCSATALAMLLRYHGRPAEIAEVAGGVHDDAYGGTGNWSFNAAYAGARGLRGLVAYLDGIDRVAAFVAAGLPVAISIGWSPGELPGAPLEHSEGHFVVVRGVERDAVAVNDPAHPAVATRYPRAELDHVFRAHGGITYLIAPRERSGELVALANA